MRIVLGVHEFFPDFAAGTEVITLSVARELRQRGHDVRIVTGYPAPPGTLTDAERFDQYIYDNFTIHRFKHSYEKIGDQANVMEHEYCNKLFGQRFEKLLEGTNPDIAHFFNLGRLSTSVLEACARRKIPAFFTATDFWAVCPLIHLRLPDNTPCNGPDAQAINCIRHLAQVTGSQRMQRMMQFTPDWALAGAIKTARAGLLASNPYMEQACAMSRRSEIVVQRLNSTRAIFAPSKLMAEMLQHHGVCPGKIRYLPYGVDISGITRKSDKGIFPRLRIGFIGTIIDHKAPHLLIEALAQLPSQAVDVTIWGPNGNQLSYIQRLHFLARQDARIKFAGTFPNESLDQILSNIDVLVVPSVWLENTPMVIYEAIAAGVPVVATDLAGLVEAIPPGAGMLFPKGNTAALARIIAELAANRDVVARMSAACIPPMTIEDHVSVLEQTYQETAESL